MSRILALDHGSRRVGVAIGETDTGLAFARPALPRRGGQRDVDAVADLVRAEVVSTILIGLPLNMDGSEGPRCQSVRQFATNIANHGPPALADLPIVFQDERLSTAAVTRGMIDDYDMSRAKRAERVDAAAAAWILESALARLK